MGRAKVKSLLHLPTRRGDPRWVPGCPVLGLGRWTSAAECPPGWTTAGEAFRRQPTAHGLSSTPRPGLIGEGVPDGLRERVDGVAGEVERLRELGGREDLPGVRSEDAVEAALRRRHEGRVVVRGGRRKAPALL